MLIDWPTERMNVNLRVWLGSGVHRFVGLNVFTHYMHAIFVFIIEYFVIKCGDYRKFICESVHCFISFTALCPYQNRFVNSLGSNDAIWRQGSGSTLAQVMALCLTAPSHYLNQCWLIIRKVQWYSSEDNFTSDISAIIHWNKLENYLYKIPLKSPRGQWVNSLGHCAAL